MDWVNDALQEQLLEIANNANFTHLITDNVENTYHLFDNGAIVPLISGALQPVGLAMCVLFFIMSLYDAAMSDRFDLEQFIKFFTKLAIGFGCVLLADEFVNLGLGMTSWIDGLISKKGEMKALPNDVKFTFPADEGLKLLVTVWLLGFILNLAFAIVSVCVTIVCFTRIMEIALRACFMPVALGFFAEDGLRGSGGRYIKRFIALCVQGPALLVISKIHSYIVTDPLTQFLSGNIDGAGALLTSVIPLLGASFAAVALCFKSISVINDVFGA